MKKDIVERTLERNKVDLDSECRWQRPSSIIKVSFDTLKDAVKNGIILDKDSHDESLEMAVASLPSQKAIGRAKELLKLKGDDPDNEPPSLMPKPPEPEAVEEEIEVPEKPRSPLAPKIVPPPPKPLPSKEPEP